VRDPRRELASASAARLSGDDYQHLFTLMQAVRLLREDVWGVRRVMMEVDQAGNVDDLIIDYVDKPTLYHQVKFTRLAGEPLEHHWFTDSGAARRSPLQRFHRSFIDLTENGVRPHMALVTNRTVAPGDPILRHIDGRDGLLTPRLANAGPTSESGTERAAWADHLGIPEDQLLEMLDHLRVQAGVGSLEQLRDGCAQAMLAAGLRGDAEAVMIGHGAIRELIESGCDQLDAAAMRTLVEHHSLAGGRPVAQLHVAAIDRGPFTDSATVTIDWVDRYEGSEARDRRRLKDAVDAPAQMSAELGDARRAVEAAGYSDLSLGGAFRLDVGFALGAEFADTAGFQLSIKQRGEVWSSEGEREPFVLEASQRDIGRGEDLTVCLSISNEMADDVCAFIESEDLPVQRILVLAPAAGADRAAIPSAAQARGCAQTALDSIRSASAGVPQLHLSSVAPTGSQSCSGTFGTACRRPAPTLTSVPAISPPSRSVADLPRGTRAKEPVSI
jgi:hypothetical protein